MIDKAKEFSILSQLDDLEIHGIITDEELEEIGIAYGSKEKYEAVMREFAERLSGVSTKRTDSIVSGMGNKSRKIKEGTSTVSVGNLQKIKRINIIGKVINTAESAARVFSSFRDPRIEIINIAYTSSTGKILAHTAWTAGLPCVTPSIYGHTLHDGYNRIQKMKDNLCADKIWIAHNHPSGNPVPSENDIAVTKGYASRFGGSFAGHIVLNHKEFSLISPNGKSRTLPLNKPVKNYIIKQRENTAISYPRLLAEMFKSILSREKDVAAYAILDGSHRVVSWIYDDNCRIADLKNYMRASGGAKVIGLTNSDFLYRQCCSEAIEAYGTKEDIFLDVIKTDRKSGLIKDHLFDVMRAGGDWQRHERQKIKLLINNQIPESEIKTENIHSNKETSGQLLNSPRKRRDKNHKEHIMPELNEGAKREYSDAEEAALRQAIHQRKIINTALKNGTLSCLPKADGYADTAPAVNLESGKVYHGANLLYLKEHQKQIGAPDAEYVTTDQLEKAKREISGLDLKEGQKGVTIHFSEQLKDGDEYENKSFVLVNVAQTTMPEVLKEWAVQRHQKRVQEHEDYKRTQDGDFYRPPEPKQKGQGADIICKSTEPVEYLGQYFAAVSMGNKFKVNPEQAKEFTDKMQTSLFEKMENGYTHPFKLQMITNRASVHCKELMKQIRAETRKVNQEQKLDQQQSRGGIGR